MYITTYRFPCVLVQFRQLEIGLSLRQYLSSPSCGICTSPVRQIAAVPELQIEVQAVHLLTQ
jgi:hypothetical protein